MFKYSTFWACASFCFYGQVRFRHSGDLPCEFVEWDVSIGWVWMLWNSVEVESSSVPSSAHVLPISITARSVSARTMSHGTEGENPCLVAHLGPVYQCMYYESECYVSPLQYKAPNSRADNFLPWRRCAIKDPKRSKKIQKDPKRSKKPYDFVDSPRRVSVEYCQVKSGTWVWWFHGQPRQPKILRVRRTKGDFLGA